MAQETGPNVFISHSHHDRDEALRLFELLKKNGASPFLDQEELRAGDNLPRKIRNGIKTCDKLLLLWSSHAARSKWVRLEWETAFETKKRIIPYVLDSAVLPDALQNFVYVEKEDQMRGHGELFKAVLGRMPAQPTGVDLFPGRWDAEITVPDGNRVVYALDLRSNGQVQGTVQMQPTGMLGMVTNMLGQDGFDAGFLMQRIPMRGRWSYQVGSGLHLDLVQSAYGREFPVNIQILTTGKRQNVLYGTGPAGARVTFRRRGN